MSNRVFEKAPAAAVKSLPRIYIFRNPATGAVKALEDVDGIIERHLARPQARA